MYINYTIKTRLKAEEIDKRVYELVTNQEVPIENFTSFLNGFTEFSGTSNKEEFKIIGLTDSASSKNSDSFRPIAKGKIKESLRYSEINITITFSKLVIILTFFLLLLSLSHFFPFLDLDLDIIDTQLPSFIFLFLIGIILVMSCIRIISLKKIIDVMLEVEKT